ncbi:MAG: hypothetical protein FWG10_00575 [Eubacteriaceae bacterium]|nr:hypothetical protein [Eubacteriaceae bacterium]
MGSNVNMDQSLSDYDKAIEELSKLLDFLPDDPAARKLWLDGMADRYIKL